MQPTSAHPSFQLHRLDQALGLHFWSARVTLDLRIIPHRNGDNMMLCYASHHEEAHRWG
ncbi:MAG: hypothetical protein LM522_10265 [Candidatus Contendobacter sp.]|nr:hypothetical protein [Candidatus Contendobacter sp.]